MGASGLDGEPGAGPALHAKLTRARASSPPTVRCLNVIRFRVVLLNAGIERLGGWDAAE